MMTDEELKEIGMTREEWDKMMEEEAQYIEDWANNVRDKIN
jgi:hypothetical protein